MRLILTLLLMTLAAPAGAEWVKYSENAQGTMVYYDPTTIKKRGDLVRVWMLQDYRKSQKGAMSIRALEEWNCTEERFRALALDTFSGPMASGQIMNSFIPK